jgi:hypothetical protein
LCACPHCSFPWCSVRHWWADCPRFNAIRLNLQRRYGVPASVWAQQPRVTSKSGWLTYDAAPGLAQRQSYAIAANILGIAVCKEASPPSADAVAAVDRSSR